MPFEIVITDEEKARRLAAGHHDYTHLLSIRGSMHQEPFRGFDSFRVAKQLNFDDVSLPRGWGRFQAPQPRHVQAILKFAETIGENDKVLVHCAQGISRSTAASYIMLASILGPGKEQEALKLVVKERPNARPNELMVRHADKLLKREGKLSAELDLLRAARFSPYPSPT
jgi:predicted protein tyrosine phosphatase